MKKQNYIIIILGLLSAIGPFSIDMYLPAFPAIARNLHTSVSSVSLSLSSFFIGISLGQLIYGPLLDKINRKMPLCAGIALYFFASLGCLWVTSVNVLIGLRFLQALGGSAGLVTSRTIVRDLFSVSDSAKIFSRLMLLIGISPILAPLFGSYVSAVWGWQYIFLTLSVLALSLLIAVYFFIPETKPQDAVRGGGSGKYLGILKEQQFYKYAISSSFSASCFYVYLANSPLVFMKVYGMSAPHYGAVFALLAAGLIGASQLNGFLLRKFQSLMILKRANLFRLATALVFFLLSLSGFLPLYALLILIFIILSCQGFTGPNATALCLASFRTNAGRASALLGAMQMLAGALSSMLVNLLNIRSALPLATIMLCFSIMSFAILQTDLIFRKFNLFKENRFGLPFRNN
ncbi:multidrug effflux MFS transporter [Mucilaginibacter sp. X4EP1]|uniref:multidrug effflux MFS transporter n=1 Tax=Mucilaginibacter sp. X4EP1 TaxID=2723092 RepID=UPI00216A3725|nr:multidrug effflux MFS transporter [Mucilaginibacter sp. X4EP1]MCS3811950.1 DHA1 family bicyclomycin/chloramphenicol resistance-like MFS transporter [Mucilaginibacter sp. X4EP1]